MPDFLDQNVEIYKELQKIYKQNVYDQLEKPTKDLVELFFQLLDEKAVDYSLTTKNSVYSNKFYQIKNRIKDDKNVYEKLIRKDWGLSISNKFDLVQNPEALKTQRPAVVNAIKEIDDLIGLRIVTELKADCDNVYKLLLNSSEFFSENEIKFIDLEGQPQTMRNGLNIFRIKGEFQGLHLFELQIKSKIDEAWGDMDHSLFYKDYVVSPIKDTVQITMNNVGGLLHEIETLLYGLRESGANYQENAAHLQFQQELDNEIAPLLRGKFSVDVNTKDSIDFLRFFRGKALDGNDGLRLEEILFDHLAWGVDDQFQQDYVEIRRSNHVLMIIEALFLNWKSLASADYTLSEGTYSGHLDEYLNFYIDFLANETEESVVDMKALITDLVKHSKSPNIFLKISLLKEAKKVCMKLDNLLFEQAITDEVMAGIKTGYRILLFGGDIDEHISSIYNEAIPLEDYVLTVKDSLVPDKTKLDKRMHEMSTTLLAAISKLQIQ